LVKRRGGDFERGLAAGCVAMAALLVSSGCGGGEASGAAGISSSAAPATAAAKAKLIERADAICRKTDEDQKAALRAYFDRHEVELTNSTEMEKAISRAEIPPLRSEIETIAAMPVPAGEEAAMSAIVAGWRQALKTAQEQPGAVFGFGGRLFEKPDELARRFGFEDCAEAL
jgi:predicted signal transduction protein with EAL and GGDEF domain